MKFTAEAINKMICDWNAGETAKGVAGKVNETLAIADAVKQVKEKQLAIARQYWKDSQALNDTLNSLKMKCEHYVVSEGVCSACGLIL